MNNILTGFLSAAKSPRTVVEFLYFFSIPLIFWTIFPAAHISPKEIFYFLLCFILGGFCLFEKQLSFPKLDRKFLIILGLYLGIFTAHVIFQNAWNYPLVLTDFFTFIFVTLYFYNHNNLEGVIQLAKKAIYACTTIILLIQAMQYLKINLPLALLNRDFYATLGNANMLAQFLGASFAFQSFFLKEENKFKYLKIFLWSLTILSLFYLNCRSVLLSCLLITTYSFWKIYSPSSRKFVGMGVAFVISVILILNLTVEESFPGKQRSLLKESTRYSKSRTANLRLELWENSIEMVKDYPLGVGPRNFEAYFPIYNMVKHSPVTYKRVFLSPHSEFFRLLTEEGPIALALLMIMLSIIIRRFYHNRKVIPYFDLVVCFMCFYLLEAIFQFPTEIPLVNSYFILLFAYALVHSFEKNSIYFPVWKRPIALWFLGFFCFYRFSMSFILETKHLRSTKNYMKAYHYYPQNWRSLLKVTSTYLKARKPLLALPLIRKGLEHQPHNFSYLYAYSYLTFNSHLRYKACRALGLYHAILKGVTSPDQVLKNKCPQEFKTYDNISLERYRELQKGFYP